MPMLPTPMINNAVNNFLKFNPSALQFPGALNSLSGMPAQTPRLQGYASVEGPSFQHVMNNVVSGINDTLKAPDVLMKESMLGGKADIHDVMIANSKAELTISLTSQVVTKMIQAYDRVQQIQI